MENSSSNRYVQVAFRGVRRMPESVLKVGAAEAERNFSLYQDKALQQPVEVIRYAYL